MNRVYILPKKLDRKYSFKEKLSVWFRGETYKENGKVKFKPYALYSKFNEFGYTIMNPYKAYVDGEWILMMDERKFYESDGFVFKSDSAKNYHKCNEYNNVLYLRKRGSRK